MYLKLLLRFFNGRWAGRGHVVKGVHGASSREAPMGPALFQSHGLGGLKRVIHFLTVLKLWKSEVKVMPSSEASLLVCGWPFSPRVFTPVSFCVCLCLNLSRKGASHTRLEPILAASLTRFFKCPVTQSSHLRYWA